MGGVPCKYVAMMFLSAAKTPATASLLHAAQLESFIMTPLRGCLHSRVASAKGNRLCPDFWKSPSHKSQILVESRD